MALSKIALIGATKGEFVSVLSKLALLHSKNQFTLAIVGDLFGDPSRVSNQDLVKLLAGDISIPLPTYFGIGLHSLPDQIKSRLDDSEDGSLCENLYFIGRRATTTTSEGIRIVILGGTLASEEESNLKDRFRPSHSLADAKVLKGANSADVLVTAIWPSSIRSGSKAQSPDGYKDPESGQHIADLCAAIKPRYHFSLSPFFFEREPFFHIAVENDPENRTITRFISLAEYGNTSKQKWMYAFSLSSRPSAGLPPGVTASPFASVVSKRSRPADSSFSRFSQDPLDHSHRVKRARKPPPGPEDCFFCLSNPNLASHLIASIGDDSYLTTAKGPLTTSGTFASLECPCHILIIPLVHTPSLFSFPDTSSQQSTVKEMNQYRDALCRMVASKSNGELGAITWEVSRSTGIHTHWQFLPIENSLITEGLVEAAFNVEAENLKFPQLVKAEATHADGDFFRLWIWSPAERGTVEPSGDLHHRSYLLRLDQSFRFDLQFGRRVLGKLLKLDSRIDWKDCGQSQEAEGADVKRFKELFQSFDFAS